MMQFDNGITPETVRAQLERIVTCQEFDASERIGGSFSTWSRKRSADRPSGSSYSIATTVFRRDASFDPQVDPLFASRQPVAALA